MADVPLLTLQSTGNGLYRRKEHDALRLTDAERAAGVTPVNYAYPPGDARRHGLSIQATAATNSAALQATSDAAYYAGGGEVYVAAGTYLTDAPVKIWEQVSLVGDGKNSTIVKKTTSTASTITDSTVRRWDAAAVGFPVCVFHFVGHNGTDNYSYGEVIDLQVQGDTSSPNTTAVEYGFYFHGMIGGRVRGCFAQFVHVGFFWGENSTITSEIAENTAGNVQRGFYQHFMTSTTFHHNYANKFRYAGYFLSAHYSHIHANAADNNGAPWKVGTTEISLAYEGNDLRSSRFVSNGCETHNGSVFKFTNSLSSIFESNYGVDITSNYTGGSDICLWENSSNNSCVYRKNRIQTTSMTGTGARHFMWKITTELGHYEWMDNRFVANLTDTTDTSTWANTSGTIIETAPIRQEIATFVPTVRGASTAGVTTYGTRNGYFERIGNTVNFLIRVTWSAQTGTGNLLIGGLPYTSANTENNPVSILSDSLTFANQLAASVKPASTDIEIYSQSTGGAATNVAVDTAATVWISGCYQV